MATQPNPVVPPVTISLSALSPISADVQAVAGAVTAVCTLLTTPAGQKLLEAELAAGQAIETAVSSTFAKMYNAIAGLLAKIKQ